MKIGVSSSWFNLLFSIVFISTTRTASAQAQCIDDLTQILQKESTTDITKARKYILCSDTTFYPGDIKEDQSGFVDNAVPLIVRSKAQVQCGADGKSTNNCIIDGSGAFGVLIDPSFFNDQIGSLNIKLTGITFSDFFIVNIITFRTHLGRLELSDCIFNFGDAPSMFEFSQILQREEDTRGRYLVSDNDNEEGEDYDYYINREEEEEEQQQQQKEKRKEIKSIEDIDWKRYFHNHKRISEGIRQRRTRRREEAPRARDLAVVSEQQQQQQQQQQHRKLQRGRRYNVFVKKCQFSDMTLPTGGGGQRGLSLLHFSAIDEANPLVDVLTDTTMNVQIVETTFDTIDTGYQEDPATTHRSIVDFYSGGKLTLRDVCFSNIKQSTKGPSALVLSHNNSDISLVKGATIHISDITYGPNAATCPLLSLIESDGEGYELTKCAAVQATAATCFNEPPAAAPPAGGGGFFGCFSSKNIVQVLTNGEDSRTIIHRRRMDQLKLGDRVLVDKDNQKYEPIYSFGHYHTTQTAQFVQLMPSRMELSSQHLIFLRDGRAVPAEIVQVGDILESGQTVTGVRSVTRHTGVYAPFTPSGKIVVNDQVASTFVSLQPKSDVLLVLGRSIGITHQWLAHTFETPHRLWCSYSGACTEEIYTIDGVSTWVSSPLKFFLWLLEDEKSIPMLSAAQVVCLSSAILMIITTASSFSRRAQLKSN